MKGPIEKKTWAEFRATGLLWWINSMLHLFGWVIVLDMKDDEIVNVIPARTSYRGFTEEANEQGYAKVTEYLKDNIGDLVQDIHAEDSELIAAMNKDKGKPATPEQVAEFKKFLNP